METRNQQGNEILHTATSVHPKPIKLYSDFNDPKVVKPIYSDFNNPKIVKPAYSHFNNVLKTGENEVEYQPGLKHYPSVDNTPVVHYRPPVKKEKEEVTCLHKNFQPAPSVPNSVIKYVR